MSEEIKVGEYVRTKKGNIGKVLDITTCTGQKRKKYLIKWNMVKAYYITGTTIVKHSHNIIDLIEVGDYVNGYQVEISRYNELYVGYVYCGGVSFRTTEAYATFIKDMEIEDIEGIVTREQFEKMEYKV
jgi:hypothetical protein